MMCGVTLYIVCRGSFVNVTLGTTKDMFVIGLGGWDAETDNCFGRIGDSSGGGFRESRIYACQLPLSAGRVKCSPDTCS